MRRLFLVVSVTLLTMLLIPVALADQPTSMTDTCKGNDGSTLGASATIKFVTGTDSGGHSILVLRSVKSVINGCNVEFAQLTFQTQSIGRLTTVWIAPGVNRTLGPTVLQKLGIDQLQFNSWGLTVRARVREAFCGAIGTVGIVESSGHVTVCPPT